MGVVTGILVTLASIAGSIGLGEAVRVIDEKITANKKLTAADIAGAVDMLATSARSKGNEVYNKLMNKISAINDPFIKSGAVKQVIMKHKKNLTEKATSISNAMHDLETKLTPLNQKLSNLSYSSDSFKRSKAGKQILEDVKTEASNAVSEAEKIIKGVEKNA